MKVQKPLPLVRQVEELSIVLRFARASFEIWWFFQNKNFYRQHRMLVSELSQFFFFNSEANLFSSVVRICVLFDKTKGALNVDDLCKQAITQKIVSNKNAEEIRDRLNRALPLAKKFQKLRHKVMAHKSKHQSFAEVYKEAMVTPNDLRQLTDYCRTILNFLRTPLNLPKIEFDREYIKDDLNELLSRMKNKDRE